MERAARKQMGLPPTTPEVISQGHREQAQIGMDFFNTFDEAHYPKGVAVLSPELYACRRSARRG